MNNEHELDWFMEQVGMEQSRLRAFVRSLGVRSEAVDDIAQDALLVAFEKRAAFDRSMDFGNWVRGIARKLVLNAIRKEARRQKFLSDPVTEMLLNAEPTELHPVSNSSEGDEAAIVALGSCIEKLPTHLRQLIHLRYFDQHTPGAIASRLEKSSNEVRQTLFRLRQALLKCVEEKTSHAAR